MNARYVTTNKASDATIAAREAVNTAEKALLAARKNNDHLLAERRFYYSAAFYFSYLGFPAQTAETDGEGKFVIEVPQTGEFVIAAQD